MKQSLFRPVGIDSLCSRHHFFISKAWLWKPFIFLVLVFSTGMFQKGHSQSFGSTKEIKIEKSEVASLFSMKSNEQRKCVLFFDQIKKEVEIQVLNHVNAGEKSGALAMRLTLEKEEARLLINRKERNGKLVYWIAVLPSSGQKAFKLLKEENDTFLLEQVEKEQVVTE